MCDILMALPGATRSGSVLFGKNSDRPIDDCQVVHAAPARPEGGSISCSHVTLADRGARATIGCRPYWCWGYETGMNDAGVVGGNTAIFTRELHRQPGETGPGLTGMDLLRLGLERGDTAEAALCSMTELLETHGQWGSGVPGQPHESGSYDNAFVLADRKEAWVLETSARRWVAERVTEGVRSLSNEPTIRYSWTRGSPDVQQHAKSNGWWSRSEAFDFALAYGDHEHYSRQVSHLRCMRSLDLLRRSTGSIDPATMMRFLRDHYEDTFLDGPQFHPFLPDFHTLCMHHSPADFTWGNTATSVVVELDPDASEPPAFWVAYLPPCVGLYSAYFLDAPIPECVTSPGTAGLEVTPAPEAPRDCFRAESLWWRFRRLTDAVARTDTSVRRTIVRERFDPLERRRLQTIGASSEGRPEDEKERLVLEQVRDTEAALAELEKEWSLDEEFVEAG